MDRGIVDNDIWHVIWRLLVSQPGSRYRAPKGCVGWRLVKCLSEEFTGAREQFWNVERPMVFMGVIL